MKYDFDKIIDRKNTFSIKLDLAAARNKPADAIALWVADMDFSTAPCVKQALPNKWSGESLVTAIPMSVITQP